MRRCVVRRGDVVEDLEKMFWWKTYQLVMFFGVALYVISDGQKIGVASLAGFLFSAIMTGLTARVIDLVRRTKQRKHGLPADGVDISRDE